jgi:hypothetical protein
VEEEQMSANMSRTTANRVVVASVVCGMAIALSAWGSTAAQESSVSSGSQGASVQGISAGSFSLDYDTAKHMGLLRAGPGSLSVDYDTARHMGRLEAGIGSSSLDYDTARHTGRLP